MASWGQFVYVFEDGRRMAMNRTMGWCNGCKGISVVEILPEKAHAGLLISPRHTSKKKSTLYQRLLNSLMFWKSPKVTIVEPTPHPGEKLEVALLHEWKEKRKLTPRCLVCGTTDIHYLPGYKKSGPDAEIMKHPGCGGALRGTYAEYRFSIELNTYLFDINGNPLQPDDPINEGVE